MIKLLVSAPGSGHGKTVLTCALLSALERRGLDPCAFKCGPDYIDPQFHRAVPGVESRNLDLFLTDGERARGDSPVTEDMADANKDRTGSIPSVSRLPARFDAWSVGHGAAVCEGAMGLYDGLGGVSDRTSAWDIARTLDLPVLLSIRAEGAALTLAAVLRGLASFRPVVRFAGAVLSRCSPSLCRTLAPVLEREAGIPILGCLPPMDAAALPSRHLGLVTPEEIADLRSRLRALGEALEANADLDRLLSLCGGTAASPRSSSGAASSPHNSGGTVSPCGGAEASPCHPGASQFPIRDGGGGKRVRIAVARDEAFCFLYQETLEVLEAQGADLAFFSPLRDRALPPGTAGLYLPGGYPELYGEALSENTAMRRAIGDAVRGGLPAAAEGGGFLYLSAGLRDAAGMRFPMADVLPGEGVPAGHLVRFGYAFLCPDTDSLLFRKGERIPVHAFHHWDSTANGTGFRLEKPLPSRRAWREGYASPTLYAGFPQLYFAGCPRLAARFVDAAVRYGRANQL